MHELSIATSIVELAEEEAERQGNVSVEAVHLRLGALSGVVKEALLSCFSLACDGTRLQGAGLIIEDVPVVVFCPRCNTEHSLGSVQSFRCPECGTPTNEIIQGKELEVVALEIAECA